MGKMSSIERINNEIKMIYDKIDKKNNTINEMNPEAFEAEFIEAEDQTCPKCHEIWKGKIFVLRCNNRRCFGSIKWQLISILDTPKSTTAKFAKLAYNVATLKKWCYEHCLVLGNLVFKRNTELVLDAIQEVSKLKLEKQRLFQILDFIQRAVIEQKSASLCTEKCTRKCKNRRCQNVKIYLTGQVGQPGNVVCLIEPFNEVTQKYDVVFELEQLLERFGGIDVEKSAINFLKEEVEADSKTDKESGYESNQLPEADQEMNLTVHEVYRSSTV